MPYRSLLVLSLVLGVVLLSCELKDDGSSKPPVRGGPPGGTNVVSRKGGDGVKGLDHRLILFAIAPTQGSTAGGTSVLLVGFNFYQAGPVTEVLFDGVPATSFVVESNNRIDALSPPHGRGLVGITIRNAGGDEDTLADIYEFVSPPPACLTLNPATGPDTGGTLVTVATANFFDDFTFDVPNVFFDTAPATSITVLDATTVLVETPPDPNPVPPPNVHAVDVTVVTTGLAETCVFPFGFTYVSPTGTPCMTLIPNSGDIAGGNTVTVLSNGSCTWSPNTTVTFGGVPAQIVTFIDTLTIEVTVPGGFAVGAVDVEATGFDATGACTCLLPNGYTYTSTTGCTIRIIQPPWGGTNGGITATFTGSGFGSVTEISFGAIFVDPNTISVDPSGTSLTCTVPPSPMGGFVDVTVFNNVGGTGCTLPSGYEYILPGASACSITSISPPNGSPMGGDTVIIIGSGFDANSGVLFGTRPATQVTFVSSTQLYVVTPPGQGTVDVVVAPEFSDPCILQGGFTYN
ncbi:MAG: IPT/TIG domain-containing protein [Planctomycetota bacterium]|nr:IPT/TIG domain-containing protein [Planctomycetota bacterium]